MNKNACLGYFCCYLGAIFFNGFEDDVNENADLSFEGADCCCRKILKIRTEAIQDLAALVEVLEKFASCFCSCCEALADCCGVEDCANAFDVLEHLNGKAPFLSEVVVELVVELPLSCFDEEARKRKAAICSWDFLLWWLLIFLFLFLLFRMFFFFVFFFRVIFFCLLLCPLFFNGMAYLVKIMDQLAEVSFVSGETH